MNPRILEPFLSTLLIVTLASFCAFTPVLSQEDPAHEWHLLYIRIRDSLVSKEEALAKLKDLERLLKDVYLNSATGKPDDHLGFPLKGYGPNAIGGKDGSGYQIQGVRFF